MERESVSLSAIITYVIVVQVVYIKTIIGWANHCGQILFTLLLLLDACVQPSKMEKKNYNSFLTGTECTLYELKVIFYAIHVLGLWILPPVRMRRRGMNCTRTHNWRTSLPLPRRPQRPIAPVFWPWAHPLTEQWLAPPSPNPTLPRLRARLSNLLSSTSGKWLATTGLLTICNCQVENEGTAAALMAFCHLTLSVKPGSRRGRGCLPSTGTQSRILIVMTESGL